MTNFDKVQGTAFIVAQYRAEENAAASPLYRDDVVELFLSDETQRAAAQVASVNPSGKISVRLRTRYMDDWLDDAIAQGCRQVVVLGAGLDTRAVRKQRTGLVYFEIDDGATLDLKEAVYARHGLTPAVKFIPADYVSDDWLALLKAAGFAPDLPTHVIWEGNTMYLQLDAVRQMLDSIRDVIPFATIAFDYVARELVERRTGDEELSRLADFFATSGAPWLTGVGSIADFAAAQSLTLVDNVPLAALHRRYWPDRPMDAKLLNYYSVCLMATELAARSQATHSN